MAMDDLMRIDGKGAEWVGAWAKSALGAGAAALGLFFAVDATDVASTTTWRLAASQWGRRIAGSPTEGEAEAKALLAFAARESGLPGIARVRVWAGDKLAASGANGTFNPVVYKMTLGEGFAASASYEQRWLVFHEAGHAAALLTARWSPEPLPAWGLSESASAAMRGSILYRQAFAESFADVFAAAMALRVDPSDPIARSEIRRSLSERVGSVSLAHDTQPALAIAFGRLGELASARGARLLALVDAIASEGAARSVGEWGAEREALCLGGWWGWRGWALDGAHRAASNPWTMAPAGPARPGEPMGAELSELMGLTPGRGWRRARLEAAWGDYAERAAQIGAPAGGAPTPPLSSALRLDPGADERARARALADAERVPDWSRRALAFPFEVAAKLGGSPMPRGCPGIEGP